jgi:hypothetical protein
MIVGKNTMDYNHFHFKQEGTHYFTITLVENTVKYLCLSFI